MCNSYVNFLLKTGEQITSVCILVSAVTGKFLSSCSYSFQVRASSECRKIVSNVISSFACSSVRASSGRNSSYCAVLFFAEKWEFLCVCVCCKPDLKYFCLCNCLKTFE